jgi:hypothetical protein
MKKIIVKLINLLPILILVLSINYVAKTPAQYNNTDEVYVLARCGNPWLCETE